jgi:hypothetical protein
MRRETRPLALGMLVQFRGSRLMGPAGLLPAMRAVALRLRRRGGDLHSIAVMIKAIVTRVLAPALGQWPRLLQLLAARALGLGDVKLGALPGARSDVDQLWRASMIDCC